MREPVNRQQRRAQAKQDRREAKALPLLDPSSYFKAKTKVVDEIQRNGITMKALEDAYKEGVERGFEEGSKDASDRIGIIMTSAMCLALSELHGFKRQRLHKIMGRMCEIMVETLTSNEIVQRVYKELGLRFDDSDPFNWLDFDD